MEGISCRRREGVNYEQKQELFTNILQRHWKWQKDRRDAWVPGFFTCKTAFVASLDVKTAFNVAQPFFDQHGEGHVAAALLVEGRVGFSMLRECGPNTYCGKPRPRCGGSRSEEKVMMNIHSVV